MKARIRNKTIKRLSTLDRLHFDLGKGRTIKSKIRNGQELVVRNWERLRTFPRLTTEQVEKIEEQRKRTNEN